MGHETAIEIVNQGQAAAYIALIPLLPFLGFLANGMGWIILRDKWPRMLVNVIAVSVVFISFALSVMAFLDLKALEEGAYLFVEPFKWIEAGGVDAPIKLVFDRLSAVMCLVVTGVGGLIHLYSTGYMSHDKSFARYFAYLNLFTFAMMLLVMGGNIVIMFVGWEGVGLCSYLLIGFWYEDPEKASAGKKAFVVNRIGDFGFLVGIFTIFWLMGTMDFAAMRDWVIAHPEVMSGKTLLGVSVATIIGIALFVGATGKSAQIPLYVWLPDAMAGPTPVSALIHAATMVTAGVYMIGRLNFIYAYSPAALMVVAGVGVVTALFSATIGFTQTDIKKVLAYSTVSQLGYMFTAMGVAAYAAGIFHLTTHAFFKALLFLGSGSVIHGLSGEQDMTKMGGLSKLMKITCWSMFAGYFAIAGFPGLAGFVSKDEILWKAYSNSVHPAQFNQIVYLIGLVAAVCTAIYMTRLMMLTFFTPSRMDPEVEHHVHESPWTMTVPLIALAILSAVGGIFNWPHALGGGASFEHWLHPMWMEVNTTHEAHGHASHAMEYVLMGLSVGLAVGAMASVAFLYYKYREKTAVIAERLGVLYRASLNKYWVDEIYETLVINPIKSISYYFLFRLFDANVIDGAVNGLAGLTKGLGHAGGRMHTGKVQTYALYIAIGLLVILTFYLGTR